ncbi:FliI/YscN family ATPase [Turneriella parva]|uniref:Type III secretion system ATPase, FliI/YscN n=1 Tax=Turneriella parva (strain ATCC BAA-1111 / DSM 21527 / NCTC 11395 / H) TaxID=869212 RepID=I4BBK3_TURPD|nr:FliI/YscN family ATPase [Turneriella parva]AFM14660.1 type III secretion system ATPase, FliI/YscN [Turneriella parva DSM 21527]
MIARNVSKEIRLLDKYRDIIRKTDTIRSLGSVLEIQGNVVFSKGPEVRLGELCHIEVNSTIERFSPTGKRAEENYILAEVVGFRESTVVLAPLEKIVGVSAGNRVVSTGNMPSVSLTSAVLGRVIDGMGRPIDNRGMLVEGETRGLYGDPPQPLSRPLIRTPMYTGVKAIDAFLTLGQGQRVGIFAGSGVGKSTLLGMIAKYSTADVNVIALIGERGREVAEFIQEQLGESGRKKSVVIASIASESPMNRVRAGYLATTIAEYFRDQGKNVLLMMDSITRLAHAQREIGLSRGEPPTTRGYPPSVFSLIPGLMERAGTSDKGSITGIYSVLVEGDDMNEPIADTARGVLDGHITLSRRLNTQNQYPAIDIADSISRTMVNVVDKEHLKNAQDFREIYTAYKENEETINLGAYARGADPVIDNAILLREPMRRFLRQTPEEQIPFEETRRQLREILGQVRARGNVPARRGA